MDLTFTLSEGVFNVRACAVIIDRDRLLAMRDERSPYCYLPGGRVRLHETAEAAILREVRKELDVDAKIVRPLWLCQDFFTEDVSRQRYHELCLYYLMDISATDPHFRGNRFTRLEGRHTHTFEWLTFDRVRGEYLYPLFIKNRLDTLPEHLEITTVVEND